MSDVILSYLNESKCLIQAEMGLKAELSDALTFEVPGFRYMPAFRRGHWDGKIRMFSEYATTLHVGLIPEVATFCQSNGYRMEASKDVMSLFRNPGYDMVKLDAWLDSLKITNKVGEEIELHDHQREAIHCAIRQKRLTLLSPTSSGKSLIIYCVARWLTEVQKLPGKVLIVVPTTGLVDQLHGDFMDYSQTEDVRVDAHQIYAGKDKESGAEIFVSTWQSLHRLPQPWFDAFSTVIIDECHNAKGPSLQKILENSVNAEFRIGTTGTLDGSKVSALVIKSALGPIKKFVTTKDLMDAGIVAQLMIKNVIISHESSERSMVTKMEYKDETAFIESHSRRTEIVADLVDGMQGNTLVLFTKKAHGKKLHLAMSGRSKKVYVLDGDNPVEERKRVKEILEAETDVILCASYGIFSTGESVKNIQNVVFGAPVKSRIRVLQSIGRGLRVNANKKSVFLWDIVDDFSTRTKEGNEKKANHCLKHFRDRCKIYDSEEFDYETQVIQA